MSNERPWNDLVFKKLLSTYAPSDLAPDRQETMLALLRAELAASAQNQAQTQAQASAQTQARDGAIEAQEGVATTTRTRIRKPQAKRPPRKPFTRFTLIAGAALAAALAFILILPQITKPQRTDEGSSPTATGAWISYEGGSGDPSGVGTTGNDAQEGSIGSSTNSGAARATELAQATTSQIVTGPQQTKIVARPGLHLELGAESSIKLSPAGLSQEGQVLQEDLIELVQGTLLVDHSSARVDFSVKTGFGTVRPIGTKFLLELTTDSLRVKVYEGAVQLDRGEGQKEELKAPLERSYTTRLQTASSEPASLASATALASGASPNPGQSAATSPGAAGSGSGGQGLSGPQSTVNQSTAETPSPSRTSNLRPSSSSATISPEPEPSGAATVEPTLLWKTKVSFGDSKLRLETEGETLLAFGEKGMAAWSLSDGRLLWSREQASTSARVVNGRVVVRSASSIIALNATTGASLWQSPAPPVQSGGFAFAGNNLVLAGADGKIQVLDASNGSLLSEAQAEFGFFGTALLVGDKLFVKQLPQSIAVFSLRSGQVSPQALAIYQSPTRLGSADLVNSNGNIMASDSRGQWYTLDPETGEFSPASAPRTALSPELSQKVLSAVQSSAQSAQRLSHLVSGRRNIIYYSNQELEVWSENP